MKVGLNQVNLIGYLGSDPEIRYSNDGVIVVSLSLATKEIWKDSQGNNRDRTEWHKIICFKKLAEIVKKIGKKGELVHILGSIHTKKWQDKSGVTKFSTQIHAQEFQILSKKPDFANERIASETSEELAF